MSFSLIFKPLAEAEVAEAFAWYSQPDIGMGAEFLDELERIERFVRFNPLLYPRVEAEIRRASLRRFANRVIAAVGWRAVLVEQSGKQGANQTWQKKGPPKGPLGLLR